MTQFHDVRQEHVVLSLCVHLSCFAHQVALHVGAVEQDKERTANITNRQSFLTSCSALLHCTTPVQATKVERVDGNLTGLFGTQRGAKRFGARFLDSTFKHSPLRFMSVTSPWLGSERNSVPLEL